MRDLPLEGKSIIFFCPKTFNYEKEIVCELERMGANVTFRSDRPAESPWVKGLVRLFPKQSWFYCDRIFNRWLDKNGPHHCDYVFIVRGEGLSPSFLRSLRNRYPDARFLLHLWDSISNIKKVELKFKCVDEVSSYDSVDCSNNEGFKFRPLFFIDKYLVNSNVSVGNKVFFVGTMHSDRAKLIYKINELLPLGVEFDYYLFFRSRLEYMFRFVFDVYIRKLDKSRLIFKPMKFDVISRKLNECSMVVDIEHPKNSGLTLRTFEMLASGKKLLTTNHNISQYEFYDPAKINIIDRTEISLSSNFFESIPVPPNDSFVRRYSLRGWLKEIFSV